MTQSTTNVFGAASSFLPPPGVMPTTTPQPPTPKHPPNTTPSNTIYINNLNEKIKIPVLKKTLRTIFERYGEILDIVAHGNLRMRGQAFVVFKDQENAAKAIKEVNGFILKEKAMLIQYARSKSDAIAISDGTIEEHKRQRLEAKEKRAKEPPQKRFKTSHSGGQAGGSASAAGGSGGAGGGDTFPASGNIADEFLPPNKILFLQNLPEDITEAMLTGLFQQYPGFKEVRTVPVKKEIAFVEYENEAQAMIAKEALSNYSDHKIKITFARK
ncbi:13374_t:CDS:2 [Ambispora gerdemannii]|uniref:13374_t:CDS:1 n=1 Tax=Ambispora gerdemannii TaxID=144530 RepID=A0A9N8VLR9_9GLOM|nr:13374_t:CDS:2 [Ambispora gerdemannii]